MGPEVVAIVVGLLVGWVADFLAKDRSYGTIADLGLGLAGGLFAVILVRAVGFDLEAGWLAMVLGALVGVASFIGAQRRLWSRPESDTLFEKYASKAYHGPTGRHFAEFPGRAFSTVAAAAAAGAERRFNMDVIDRSDSAPMNGRRGSPADDANQGRKGSKWRSNGWRASGFVRCVPTASSESGLPSSRLNWPCRSVPAKHGHEPGPEPDRAADRRAARVAVGRRRASCRIRRTVSA